MCMISLQINDVTDTNIFVALNDEKKRQLTVYSNLIDNDVKANAMVIPVPYPNTVQFHDMSSYKNFFSDCDKSFKLQSLEKDKSLLTNSFNDNKKIIGVKNIGSYKVSIASSLNELDNIDKNVFILSNELKNILSKNYNGNVWGFIIFVLATDKKEYHPFGWSHDLLNRQVYIPTRHYHGHQNKMSNNLQLISEKSHKEKMTDEKLTDETMTYKKMTDEKMTNETMADETIADDWSHKIYLYNIDNNKIENNDFIKKVATHKYVYKWENNFEFNKSKFNNFSMNSNINFSKFDIKGLYENNDIMISVY